MRLQIASDTKYHERCKNMDGPNMQAYRRGKNDSPLQMHFDGHKTLNEGLKDPPLTNGAKDKEFSY